MTKNKLYNILEIIIFNVLVYIGLAIRYPSENENRIINGTTYNQILILALIILLNIMIQYCKSNQLNALINFLNIFCAMVYSGILVIGHSYIARQNLSLIWGSKRDILYTILACISLTIFLYFTFLTIYIAISKIKYRSFNRLKGGLFLRTFLIIFCCFLVLWIPYFIITNPGLAGNDGMTQINELFYQKTFDGYFTPTNHHPVFTSILQGGFLKIGIGLFHSINSGILINSIFLNMLTISCFSILIITIMRFYGIKPGIVTLLFLGLFPVFPLWANALDKTGYFSAILALFLANVINIDEGNVTGLSLSILLISGTLLGLIRNDGLIYVVAIMIGSLTLKRKKLIFISLMLSAILICTLGRVLMYSTKALPTEPMESLAVPMQQVSRVVKYNPSSLTNGEKKTLNKFFHYSKMAEVYNPEFADPAKLNSRWPYRQFIGSYRDRKEKFDNQNFVKNKKELVQVWENVGWKNKKLYFEAFVGENIFYLYPQDHPTIFLWMAGTPTSKLFVTKIFKNYKLNHPNAFSKLVKNMLIISNLPILNLLFVSFTWFTLWGVGSLILLDSRKIEYLNLILLGAAIIVIELFSPLNGYLRYTFPLIELVPILSIVSLRNKE